MQSSRRSAARRLACSGPLIRGLPFVGLPLLGLTVLGLTTALLLSLSAPLGQAQNSEREPSFGRGGFDLGWGKPDDDDDDEDAKKATPTPTATPKPKDDSFFKRDVEDTRAEEKL